MPQIQATPETEVWRGARRMAEMLVESLNDPATLEQLVTTLKTPFRSGSGCASRILATVEEASAADKVPLLAYALAFHDVVEIDTARPTDTDQAVTPIERAYWLEQIRERLDALVSTLKTTNSAVNEAAVALLDFFEGRPRVARVVALSAILHGPLVPWFHDPQPSPMLSDEAWQAASQRLKSIIIEGRLALDAGLSWTQSANFIVRLIADLSAGDQDVVLSQLFVAASFATQTQVLDVKILGGEELPQSIAELLERLKGES